LVTVLAALLMPAVLGAQAGGSINGRIIDRVTNAPVEGVSVSIATARATSNAEGRYSIPVVPAGSHVVLARRIGYAAQTHTVSIHSDGTTTLDLVMESIPALLADVHVTSASRLPERIVDAPAAITTIPSDRLREASATGQLATAVAEIPGLQLAQSGMFDFNVNARGFNGPLNRRMLILVDGREQSVPIQGNQEWADLATLTDATRIELLRGPGSALYGANAFNGVLSITTPSVRETRGTRATLSFGELATKRFDAQHSFVTNDSRWGIRFSGGYSESQSWDQSRTNTGDLRREYAGAGVDTAAANMFPPGFEALPLRGQTRESAFGTPGPVTGDIDAGRQFDGRLRIDRYFSNGSYGTAEGGYAQAENGVIYSQVGRSQINEAKRPWARLAWSSERASVMAYYTGRNGDQTSLGSGVVAKESSGIVHLEGQFNREFAGDRGRYVAGASIRNTSIDSRGTLLLPEADGRNDQNYALFGQVEYDVARSLKAIIAGRLDAGTRFDGQFSPKLGLVFHPRLNHSWRVTYNRAYLTPSALAKYLSFPVGLPADLMALENGLRAAFGPALDGVPEGTLFTTSAAVPILALGNEHMLSEKIHGFELGYKGQLGRVFATVDLYRDEISDFTTDIRAGVNPSFGPWTAPDAVPAEARGALEGAVTGAIGPALTRLRDGSSALVVSFGNTGKATEWGAELSAGASLTTSLSAQLSYAHHEFRLDHDEFAPEDTVFSNTPKNSWSLSSTYSGPQGLRVRASVRAADPFRYRTTQWRGLVPHTTTVDANVMYPFTDRLRVSVVATNVLDERRFQVFGGSIIGRRIVGSVSYTW
jgi:iron complex outermembrane receptor protein